MGIVSRIYLRDFRNLTSVDSEFVPGLNLVVGRNGQGKTSLLEGVHYLAFLRSFRTRRPAEMIRWGAAGFKLEADIAAPLAVSSVFGGGKIGVYYADGRELTRDGKTISVAADFINTFLCVALVPEDLSLIKGPPLLRRRFIDMLLCQISRKYLLALLTYNRALVNRNAMLKEPHRYGATAIRGYDSVLAASGADLTFTRACLMQQLDERFAELYASLYGRVCQAGIIFQSSMFRRQAKSLSAVEMERESMACLEREFKRDVERRTTRYGPHRDDLAIHLDQRPLGTYGSEGQCRLAALALKLSAMNVLTDSSPTDTDLVLLVDDVFGELDEPRRGRFFAAIEEARQVIVACTSPPSELSGKGSRYTMTAGVMSGEGR